MSPAALLRAAPLLLLLAAAGCFKSPGTGGPTKNCSTSSDCTAGNRCVAGACTPGCRADADCPGHGLCHADGTCGSRPACTQDTDCPATFQCQAGRCACTTDYACWAAGGGAPDRTRICVQGSCQASTACTADAQCSGGRYCGPAGVCTAPCLADADCGGASQVGGALTCHSGRCTSPCITDAAPPGQGGCPTAQICVSGLCSPADCQTFTDCGDPTLYCTSADHGHCKPVRACDPTLPDVCGPQADCTRYPPDQCPPGFDCSRQVCVDLPPCLVDGQCGPGEVCDLGGCRAAPACQQQLDCDATHDCIGGHCVPHVCRGASDCAAGKVCSGGLCTLPSTGANVARVRLLAAVAPLEVGQRRQLFAVALDAVGNAMPVAGFDWSVAPASVATIDAQGVLVAVAPGAATVTVGFTRPDHTQATPDQGPFTVLAAPATATGRALVVDSASGQPIAGARVRVCSGGYDGGACSAPVDRTTDATGTVTFPAPAGAYDLSVAADLGAARPAHDVVHVLNITASDVLVPLPVNEAGESAGFTGSIDFSKVKTQGDFRVGLAGSSLPDLASFALEDLLGQPWVSTATVPTSPFGGGVPGLDGGTIRVPLSGGTVADLDAIPGLGVGVHIKDNVYALGRPGLRSAWAFAGRVDPQLFFGSYGQAFATGAVGGVLPFFGAFDHGLRATIDEPLLPRVLDQEDLDGNGVCEDRAVCATSGQLLPDYGHFPGNLFTPSQSQSLRVEISSPANPDGAGQVILLAGAQVPGTGLLPLGLTSARGGGGAPSDETLRLAPLYGGLEASSYGMLALATAGGGAGAQDGGAPTANGNALSVAIARTATLPPTVDLSAPLLPFIRGAHYDPASRRLDLGGGFGAIVPGAELVRVTLAGSSQRVFVYARPGDAAGGLFVPPSPGDTDPALDPALQTTVAAVHLPPGDNLDALASLPGDTLLDLSALALGFTRASAQ